MKTISYHHDQNSHSRTSPRIVLNHFFGPQIPASLLDVGCGQGTWAASAAEMEVPQILGVDGVNIPSSQLLIPEKNFRHIDLEQEEWGINQRFETCLCLEVAEHLEPAAARNLVSQLTRLSDTILFSAAPPKQPGENHLHCQWPDYWQELFNQFNFTCSDELRWEIWDDPRIEPWYRQNIFVATREPEKAGNEPRIKSVVHPDAWWLNTRTYFSEQIENGSMPVSFYMKAPLKALITKTCRLWKSRNADIKNLTRNHE